MRMGLPKQAILAVRPQRESQFRGGCDGRKLIAQPCKRPLFCGRPATLKLRRDADAWRLWAEDDGGRPAMEMQIT